MAFHPKTLLVMSNPYHAVDHKGRPAGAFPMEDENPAMPMFKHVGATKRIHGDPGDHEGDLVWDFDDKPVRILNTQHHKHGVMSGTTLEGAQLIAADLETAKECGISEKDFIKPEKVREATKVAMLARWALENDGLDPLDPAPAPVLPEPPAPKNEGFVVRAGAIEGTPPTGPAATPQKKAAE